MTVQLRYGSITDTGRVRPANEDSLLVAEPVFAVADGMGGHAAGEVASRVAVTTLSQAFVPGEPASVEGIIDAVRRANRDIVRQSLDSIALRGMGTTLTGIALVGEGGETKVAVFNVGDSRTYRLREGHLTALTTDHSYVQELVNLGEISPAQARVHPHRNIVTRALGIEEDVAVDIAEEPPVTGDRYLVCSDGLVDELDDAAIERVLANVADPQEAAEELARQANAAGGRDNVTVIVVDVTSPGAEAPGAAGAAEVGGWLGDDQAPLDTTAVPAPTPAPDVQPAVATKKKRRRRPRGITIATAVAVLALFGAAFAAINWYGRGGYYLAFEGDQVAVFQGRPGGVLWIDPTLAGTYVLSREQLTEAGQRRVDDNPTFGSREEADEYLADMEADPASVIPPTTTTTSTTTTTTTTTTTAPPSPVST